MRLRFALPSDAEALLEIYRPYVEETTISFETETPSLPVFRRRMEEISARFPYIVLEESGEILGYAYAHPFHERAAFDWTLETTVYVRRDARGRGIGAALYRSLLALLTAQGAVTACAVVTVPNDPSVAFHQTMGFTQEGVLPHVGFKLDRWCGITYLCRRLNDGVPAPGPLRGVWELEKTEIESIFAKALEKP